MSLVEFESRFSLVLSIIIMSFLSLIIHAQNTVGVIINEDEASDHYCFFSPFSGDNAYMVDRCGRLVNTWRRGTRPGLSAYFLENGLMLRKYKPSPVGPFTSASNAGGLELVDWNNNTVWQFELNTATEISHHDAVQMPNGNILVLTWELVFRDEIIEMGRDPNEISSLGFMWSEKIIEIEPIYPNDYNIVWQWEIKDHYIQDFDPTKQNFGVVENHPELFDINLPDINSSNSNASRDWNHFNSIDYNETLDQILISTRNSDEIWILDHSTTTEEAAGHTGGNAGRGGDILYRWGNPSAYRAAPISEQVLFGQHGVHWIPEGLEDEGKILIYNNGNGRFGGNYSTVEIINPPMDNDGNYFLESDGKFGPDQPEWTYGHEAHERFYSPFLSNAQRLNNGNTLINAGSNGFAFEITPDKDIVWSYETPLFGNTPATQGINVNNNASFRVYKYPKDYPGFEGIDIEPGEPIELNPSLVNCETTSIDQLNLPDCSLTYNMTQQKLIIPDQLITSDSYLQVFDLSGRQLIKKNDLSGAGILTGLPEGIYIASLVTKDRVTCQLKFALH